MKNWTRATFLVAVSAFGGGCITIGDHFTKHALDRASFEMQCSKERLQITGLNAGLDRQVGIGNQVGVSGCGQQAVYVLTSNGWILNSHEGDRGSQPSHSTHQ